MEAADKRLIVVIEGTAALGFYWPSIFADYVEKIVRSFCGSDIPGQKPATSGSNFELGLVMFYSHGSYSGCVVQRSSWTKDVDRFLGWLSSICFSGRGLDDVAIAEGLYETLMMFAIPQNGYQTQQSVDGKKHCILVAASNPYALPTPVYRPQIDSSEQAQKTEEQTKSLLHDADAMAQCFRQCSISLSVISPKQHQKLRALYDAGKRNPRATEPLVDVKQPHFLVLIADNFMEARDALSIPLGVVMGQSVPGMSQGGIPQMTQTGTVFNPNMMSNMGSSGVCPVTGNGTMILTPGMSTQVQPGMSQQGQPGMPQQVPAGMSQPMQSGIPQQVQTGTQNVVMNNNLAQSKYVRVWEGGLSALRQGRSVLITRLEGYRKSSASATLAADWPPTMQIVRLISQDHMNYKHREADFLVFRARHHHGFLRVIEEKKLCAVIRLPSQTLLLSTTARACRLVGMLFPRDMVAFTRTANQRQQQQMQRRELQNQQQLLQQLQEQIRQLQQLQETQRNTSVTLIEKTPDQKNPKNP